MAEEATGMDRPDGAMDQSPTEDAFMMETRVVGSPPATEQLTGMPSMPVAEAPAAEAPVAEAPVAEAPRPRPPHVRARWPRRRWQPQPLRCRGRGPTPAAPVAAAPAAAPAAPARLLRHARHLR